MGDNVDKSSMYTHMNSDTAGLAVVRSHTEGP